MLFEKEKCYIFTIFWFSQQIIISKLLLGVIGGLKINFRMNSCLKLMIICHIEFVITIFYTKLVHYTKWVYDTTIWIQKQHDQTEVRTQLIVHKFALIGVVAPLYLWYVRTMAQRTRSVLTCDRFCKFVTLMSMDSILILRKIQKERKNKMLCLLRVSNKFLMAYCY